MVCNGPEIMGMDKKEEELQKRFEEAQDNAPAIILLDEIESLAPRREGNTSEAVKRMVSCLLLQIDALSRTTIPVLVIGCTASPSAVDGSLRRFGRRVGFIRFHLVLFVCLFLVLFVCLGNHEYSCLTPHTSHLIPIRFDRELDLGVPDDVGREEIFRVHTRNMKVRSC